MSAVQTTAIEDLDRWADDGGPAFPESEEPQRHARMTYRERRLARAEKLRGWAEKREQRAEQAYERATELGQMIPFGQPILVGHHSEKGHRAHIQKIDSAMRQSCENSAKAERMEAKADEIEYQALRSIYSDDPDAIERLAQKVRTLETKREVMKGANVAARKDGKTAPFPSWSLTNLGATIRTTKKRLEQLQREQVNGPSFRTISARFASSCDGCGQAIEKGSTIRYARNVGAFHVGCEVTR